MKYNVDCGLCSLLMFSVDTASLETTANSYYFPSSEIHWDVGEPTEVTGFTGTGSSLPHHPLLWV